MVYHRWFSTFLFNTPVKWSKKIRWDLKLNRLHNLLVYADDINVNREKTMYMLTSRRQNEGQNRNMKITNRFIQNVAKFTYLGTTVANGNLIQEEIKSRLNSDKACYHSLQNLLSCRLLSKSVRINVYKTIVLRVTFFYLFIFRYSKKLGDTTFRKRSPSDLR
jgi:hypothetical protein